MSPQDATQEATDLRAYCEDLGRRARTACRDLVDRRGGERAAVLHRAAERLEARQAEIVEANRVDLAHAGEHGLTEAMVSRLTLGEKPIRKMADAMRQIAEQVDPVGELVHGSRRPNGLRVEKVRVPLGVVLFIYESRPNVTADAAALCIKSGNALILRGGKEARQSNRAIVGVIRDALEEGGLDPNTVQFVEVPDREAVSHLLRMTDTVDLAIPRGGAGLIQAVVEQAHVPVIKHYAGNCHLYVDEHATELPGTTVRDVCVNAKVQKPGVCNAAETMVFHAGATDPLVDVGKALAEEGVEIRGCERTRTLLADQVDSGRLRPAEEADWFTEFLEKTVAVRVVDSFDEAIDHINHYGSNHTDAILTSRIDRADAFTQRVDSASVMVNCSPRFSDGGEYGLGAEIGISTDKLHARGPMGAADLTTTKWVVRGDGQVRS